MHKTLLVSTVLLSLALSGCGTPQLSQQQLSLLKLDAPENIEKNWGTFAKVIGKPLFDTEGNRIRTFEWKVPGYQAVMTEYSPYYTRSLSYRVNPEAKSERWNLEVWVEDAMVPFSGFNVSPDGTVAFEYHCGTFKFCPDGRVIFVAPARLEYHTGGKAASVWRVIDQATFDTKVQAFAATQSAEERRKTEASAEFWNGVATGVQVLAQAANEVAAERAMQDAADVRQAARVQEAAMSQARKVAATREAKAINPSQQVAAEHARIAQRTADQQAEQRSRDLDLAWKKLENARMEAGKTVDNKASGGKSTGQHNLVFYVYVPLDEPLNGQNGICASQVFDVPAPGWYPNANDVSAIQALIRPYQTRIAAACRKRYKLVERSADYGGNVVWSDQHSPQKVRELHADLLRMKQAVINI